MNGIIVDIKGKNAALLCEDGSVRKITNHSYALGDVVVWTPKKGLSLGSVLRFAATAAAALVAVLGIGAGTAYAIPYGTVSVDVNPSIEYTVNVFDYVLSVKGVNADGEAILAELDTNALKHHSIAQAIETTLQEIESEGYFKNEGANVLIAVAAPSSSYSERLRSDLERKASEEMELSTRSVTVTPEDVNRAHERGTTAGRLWEQEQAPEEERQSLTPKGQPNTSLQPNEEQEAIPEDKAWDNKEDIYPTDPPTGAGDPSREEQGFSAPSNENTADTERKNEPPNGEAPFSETADGPSEAKQSIPAPLHEEDIRSIGISLDLGGYRQQFCSCSL